MTNTKIQILREHALCLLNHNCKDYSQWFPGIDNNVADSLSRDLHLPNYTLTQLFHYLIPEQIPQNFKISPLPHKMESVLSLTLQKLPEEMQLLERHKTSKLSCGAAGLNFSKVSASDMTSSFQNYQKDNKQSLSQPLPRQSNQENFLETVILPFTV